MTVDTQEFQKAKPVTARNHVKAIEHEKMRRRESVLHSLEIHSESDGLFSFSAMRTSEGTP